jgi:dTDP-4-dehydrorhamnose 3,5-epimerase
MRIPVLYTDIIRRSDNRGCFYESYRQGEFNYVQCNHSISHRGVVRGLHYQWDGPLEKLVRVSQGAVVDVLVDLRPDSPYYGRVGYYELNDRNLHQLYVPAGFAHGFQALEDNTHVQYMYSHLYNRDGEAGINPLDPELNIAWPIKDSIISERDLKSHTFQEYKLNPKF